MTNFEIVKNKMSLEDMPKNEYGRNIFCKTIHDIRKEENCNDRDCIECKKWLMRNEGILNEYERNYLLNVITPFRESITNIYKSTVEKKTKKRSKKEYFINIVLKSGEICKLPLLDCRNMCEGMEELNVYTLEELGI